MSSIDSTARRVSISDFKAHCTEYLRQVERDQVQLIITRHGQDIALAKSPEPDLTSAPLLGAAIGSAELSQSYDPHSPAFAEDDWDLNR